MASCMRGSERAAHLAASHCSGGPECDVVHGGRSAADWSEYPRPRYAETVMVLTARQAADAYASRLVDDVHRRMAERMAADRGHNVAGALWSAMNELTADLYHGLISIYAELPDAAMPEVRTSLIEEIQQRLSRFVQSCVATHGSSTGAGAARHGLTLIGRYQSGIPADFDLAVYEKRQRQSHVNNNAQSDDRKETVSPNARDVFVVHGRDLARKNFFFDLLRRMNLHPLEFDELIARTGSGSPYIGDVVRSAFDQAQAVLVLFTGDDLASLQPDLLGPSDGANERTATPQPRPNVLFEAGMAIALQRERTIIVEVGQLRGLSDLQGIHAVRFTNGTPEERNKLASRLRAARCDVVTDGSDWLNLPFPQ